MMMMMMRRHARYWRQNETLEQLYVSVLLDFRLVEDLIERPRSQDSRLRSHMGGVEFINFANASFRSEICSEQLPAATARIRGQIQKM